LSTAAYAQSMGEKTGVNSTLGIAPKTEDFIKEAAMSDMLEIDAASDCRLGSQYNFSAPLGDLGKLIEPRFDP
jgi:hypothetical protein